MRFVQDLKRQLFGTRRGAMELGSRSGRHLTQDLGPWIVGPVDAVAETGEPFVAGVGFAHPLLSVLG
jgi:hypothetical protein